MLKFDKILQNINDKVFKPFVYKGVLIAASNINSDPYHLTNRLKQGSK